VAGRTATVEVLSEKSISLAWLFRFRHRAGVATQQSKHSSRFGADPAQFLIRRSVTNRRVDLMPDYTLAAHDVPQIDHKQKGATDISSK
jgi:hypothetical protein